MPFRLRSEKIELPHLIIFATQPHNQRCCSLVFTKLHISSTSAATSGSSARHNRTIVCLGSSSANTASFTAFNPGLFFEGFHHSCRANSQHPCGISDATPVHRHLTDLLLHLGRIGSVAVGSDKGAPRAVQILAPIALFSGCGCAMSNHVDPITIWAMNWL